MSNETIDTAEDNLDDFSADFFNPKEEAVETESPEDSDAPVETDTSEEDVPEEEDTLAPEDEETETDEEDENGQEDPDEPVQKPKKNRFQERIDEVVGKQREAERKAVELEARLNEALQKLQQNTEPKPATKPQEDTGPQPTDTNEDGTDKYPLGEFDPNYIKDVVSHTLKTERELSEAQSRRENEEKAIREQQEELQTSWADKSVAAKERYPDFQEKGQQLLDTFEGIDEAYGEYLSATLMSMDHGPDVLYYLANHPDEADAIVKSGPTKATIALGRLEASFVTSEEPKPRPRVSKAPTPPPVNKGSSPAKTSVQPDTDDLDAFSSEFFKKKKGG